MMLRVGECQGRYDGKGTTMAECIGVVGPSRSADVLSRVAPTAGAMLGVAGLFH